ncbi:MAG TPA: HAD family acid phosphatase [Longimicrobiales bacterium]|nr:HAD family acid phosphatase [Longimicrobiales bacterium]
MRIPIAIILFTAACAPRAATVVDSPAPGAVDAPAPVAVDTTRPIPNDIHWVRSSAEYRALTLQTYRAATARARALAQGRAPGSWAVILDADETVIDNTEYQRRIAVRGLRYDTASFHAWARERAAVIVPGADAFIHEVQRLGGRVAIVTNRDEPVCEDTRANLEQVGIRDALVLCRVAGVSDKNPRYRAVAEGTAGRPPAAVLVWVGDNIQDFPELRQDARGREDGLDLFGDRYFMLPNPMYGSWESLPRR